MNMLTGAIGLGLVGLTLGATAAQAEPPGVYYAWQTLTGDTAQCLNRANQALSRQNLTLFQTDPSSIAGQSDAVTAVFVCLQNPGNTTVMMIVASEDEPQAMALREALKTSF
jgi:hypothetical protein